MTGPLDDCGRAVAEELDFDEAEAREITRDLQAQQARGKDLRVYARDAAERARIAAALKRKAAGLNVMLRDEWEQDLARMAGLAAPGLRAAPLLTSQACFRPTTRDGLPLLGPVPGIAGAFVATGHGPWGILNASASGEAMAELIMDGRSRAVPLAAFDPGRFARSRPVRR